MATGAVGRTMQPLTRAAEARTTPLTDELRALINTFGSLIELYTAPTPASVHPESYAAGYKNGARMAFADAVLRLQTLAEFGGGE